MTLPNKLTLMRILLVPVMIIISVIDALNNNYIGSTHLSIANLVNVIIFIVASLTDFLDGYLARKNNQVTTFGKFADPLADKMLVISSLIILMNDYLTHADSTLYRAKIEAWVVCVIVIRELMVSGIRLVAAEHGEVLAAGWSGKIKTAFTMVTIILCFLNGLFSSGVMTIICLVCVYISALLTIYSGLEYLIKNRKIVFSSI